MCYQSEVEDAGCRYRRQWRTQQVAWVGQGLPTNLAQNSITTFQKLVHGHSRLSLGRRHRKSTSSSKKITYPRGIKLGTSCLGLQRAYQSSYESLLDR